MRITTAKQRSAYSDTIVPVHESREDIEKYLAAITVTSVAWAKAEHPDYPGKIVVALRFTRVETTGHTKAPIGVRIIVPVPISRNVKEQDQLLRQYHRALYWYLKAQVEAVQFGLVQFTEAFLPHLELPGGQTVFQQIGPQYLRSAALGEIRPLALLPGKE